MRDFGVLASQILVPAFFAFVLLWALAGVAIGAGLLSSQATMLRFFSWVNTWVSTRASLKWAELPRDTDRAVFAYRAWFAAAFIAGGVFMLVMTLSQFDLNQLTVRPQFIHAWLLGSLKWLLVAGSVLAIVVGVMLALFPAALRALEAHSDRWVSTRQAAREIGEGGNRMHLALERCVAACPRTAGWTLAILSLACAIAAGSALFVR